MISFFSTNQTNLLVNIHWYSLHNFFEAFNVIICVEEKGSLFLVLAPPTGN
jgi:hypothetical protein